MDELERARIRVYRNDPAGRGERLVASDPPLSSEDGAWAFRVEGRAPVPKPYPPDTAEFLHWQLASALERGKRLWQELRPGGRWVPGAVLPAVPVAGDDLNAYYDRRALRFFRDEDSRTGAIVQSGDSVDVVTHEQGHAVLDALRPDLWDAPHFEVAAFHEAFGDLAAIFVALAEPSLESRVIDETSADPARSNLVSRLAEELGGAVRARYGEDAAMPRSLRDAVNAFRYADPKGLPDAAPASTLSAEPHSFCNVMSGACWDLLVARFHADPSEDRVAALRDAGASLARLVVAAAEGAPSGADFFGRVARRLVRTARDAGDGSAPAFARALLARGLLSAADVGEELAPDEDRGIFAPDEGGPLPRALREAIEARLPPPRGGEIVARAALGPERPSRLLRGRRRRDLLLRGTEYGPADGAAVELSDSFALAFEGSGLLRASRFHPASDRDADDARAFVRFLARRRAIADEAEGRAATRRLARDGKSHAVIRDDDGVRRLRRLWVAKEER